MSPLDPKRRVVVTGLGVVSSIGIGWEEFWKNLLAGKSGISRISRFDTTGFNRHNAGEVKNFQFSRFFLNNVTDKFGRASQFALVAAKFALEDSRIELNKAMRSKSIVCVGTTNAENNVLESMGDHFYSSKNNVNFQDCSKFMATNILGESLAKEFRFCGNNFVFGTACSSGNCAISMGFDLIRAGKAEYALVGGADALSRITYTGFERVYAIAPDKCQPFDLNRQGMIPGEGAGMLFIETLESASQREADIYAEIIGYGMSCDGHHMTNPDPRLIAKSISKSIKNSGVLINEVDYISAHGTGTIENDTAECEAIHSVFGGLSKHIPISSIKSMLGHTMGAASALEAIACCLTIKNNEIPPTINLETQDDKCAIDCVPHRSRKKNVRISLNNSQAFGGNNVCLATRCFSR